MEENIYNSITKAIIEKYVLIAKCNRCNESWNPKTDKVIPKRCAKCNSPYWNKPRLRTLSDDKWGFGKWEIEKWYLLPNFQTDEGNIDMDKNSKRWRALTQFARRRGLNCQFNGNSGKMFARLVK